MLDPTRIDATLTALRRAWEGQPELPLATLFGIAQNLGGGWNASDKELAAIFNRLAGTHPPQLPLGVGQRVEPGERWLAVTESPDHRVTLSDDHVIVRARLSDGSMRQPVAWRYSSLRPTGPGRPLVARDEERNEHRLGVVRFLSRLAEAPVDDLSGITRRSLGERVYFIRGTDEEERTVTVLLDHGLHVTTRYNRELKHADYSWVKIQQCRRGFELIAQLPGGNNVPVCRVAEIYLAEAESRLEAELKALDG